MSETIDLLMELLNEYRESGCALDESRVTYYARMLETDDEHDKEINLLIETVHSQSDLITKLLDETK